MIWGGWEKSFVQYPNQMGFRAQSFNTPLRLRWFERTVHTIHHYQGSRFSRQRPFSPIMNEVKEMQSILFATLNKLKNNELLTLKPFK